MTTVRRIVQIAIFLVLLLTGWQFAHQNGSVVSVDYVLGRTPDVALWKVLLITAAAGVVLTGLLLGFALLRARLESRRYRRALVDLESEVHQLRNLPVVSGDGAASGTPTVLSGGAVESG